ncbi:MAG: hypothetical protein DI571_12270, partial [Arsenicicoccus sp.]
MDVQPVAGDPGTIEVSAKVPLTWTSTASQSELLAPDADEATSDPQESTVTGGAEEISGEQS